MAKTKKNQTSKKEKISRKMKYLVVGIIVVLLAVSFMAYKDLLNRGQETKTEDFSFYDEDICRCVERERQTCPDDTWTLDAENRLCRSNKTVTNPVLRCSMYECAGTQYKFNQNISDWEVRVEQNG